ncbi:hypothetical protein [Capybara microvirus Cap3_SP_437]|nr:hypothetical protein [Capybara microvirus Cap3_SP_437]
MKVYEGFEKINSFRIVAIPDTKRLFELYRQSPNLVGNEDETIDLALESAQRPTDSMALYELYSRSIDSE